VTIIAAAKSREPPIQMPTREMTEINLQIGSRRRKSRTRPIAAATKCQSDIAARSV
jgi:hypothetical protein